MIDLGNWSNNGTTYYGLEAQTPAFIPGRIVSLAQTTSGSLMSVQQTTTTNGTLCWSTAPISSCASVSVNPVSSITSSVDANMYSGWTGLNNTPAPGFPLLPRPPAETWGSGAPIASSGAQDWSTSYNNSSAQPVYTNSMAVGSSRGSGTNSTTLSDLTLHGRTVDMAQSQREVEVSMMKMLICYCVGLNGIIIVRGTRFISS